jgi:glycosyltransferase involved in cell wall biosynthesis
MKIGIDARFYGPRVGGGGLGRYVAELVNHLQLIDKKNEYVVFLKKENFHECVITNPNFNKRLVDIHWYGIREQFSMPRIVKQSGVDFMHYPHWNVPVFARKPFLVTIHDLILLEDKASARSSTRSALVHGFKYAGFRTVLEHAIHSSQHILTVSEYTKSRILKHFGIKKKKINVVHNGIIPAQDVRDVNLSKLGVYEPYFLYIGNAYPHKNLEMMLHAFSRFSESNPYVQMVIAGRRDIFSRRLEKEAKEIGIKKAALRFIDLPTDREIATLYKHAALFIYPSRIEGFGMPPLEAMSYGTPTAAARSSSLPEVLQNRAFYFDPDDIETLVEIMNSTISNPERFIKNRIDAMKLAQSYTWKKTAEKTLEVYSKFYTTKR